MIAQCQAKAAMKRDPVAEYSRHLEVQIVRRKAKGVYPASLVEARCDLGVLLAQAATDSQPSSWAVLCRLRRALVCLPFGPLSLPPVPLARSASLLRRQAAPSRTTGPGQRIEW